MDGQRDSLRHKNMDKMGARLHAKSAENSGIESIISKVPINMLSKKFEVNLSKYEVSEPSQIKEKLQMSWNLRTYGRWTTSLIPVIKTWLYKL